MRLILNNVKSKMICPLLPRTSISATASVDSADVLMEFPLLRMLIDLLQIMMPFSYPKLGDGRHDIVTFHSPIKLLIIYFCFYKNIIAKFCNIALRFDL